MNIAKQPTEHETDPRNKELSCSNVNSAELRKT